MDSDRIPFSHYPDKSIFEQFDRFWVSSSSFVIYSGTPLPSPVSLESTELLRPKMEVDNAHIPTDSANDLDSLPSYSGSSSNTVTAMDAEDVVQQYITEASHSPNSIPMLTR